MEKLKEKLKKLNLLLNIQLWMCMLSCFNRVQLFAAPWTVACQALLSMGFSRQEYWSGMPCPPPGFLPDPGIEPTSFTSPSLAGGFFITSTTWEALSWGHFLSISDACKTWRSRLATSHPIQVFPGRHEEAFQRSKSPWVPFHHMAPASKARPLWGDPVRFRYGDIKPLGASENY